MRRNIILGAVIFALIFVYLYILPNVIAYGLALPSPAWWAAMFPTRLSAVLTWTFLCHTAAILLASLPLALIITSLYPRRWLAAAFAVSLALFGLEVVPGLIDTFAATSVRMKVIDILDSIKLVGTLPLLVWVIRRLSFKYHVERS